MNCGQLEDVVFGVKQAASLDRKWHVSFFNEWPLINYNLAVIRRQTVSKWQPIKANFP